MKFAILLPVLLLISQSPVCAADQPPNRSTSESPPLEPDDLYSDGRDHWSLLPQSPLNRQLHEQLKLPSEKTRLWQRPDSRFAFLADASTGGQQSLPGTGYDQTRYHGFFILNSFGAVRLFNALDVNLNLNFLNPSFCDGYHKSFQMLAGLSIHFHRTLLEIAHHPLRFHALLMDLDVVTFGEGLLIEQLPLEGFNFSFEWRHMSLSATIAARVFWHYDDLLMIPLKFFNGRLTLLTAMWYFTKPGPEGESDSFDIIRNSNDVQSFFPYIGISAHQDWQKKFRVAAEYLALVKNGRIANATMFRADYKTDIISRARLHFGYQFRYYQKQFAPLEELSMPTTSPQIPAREDTYATNSFEYLGISPWFNQYSHTLMSEAQLNLTPQLQLYYELECWFRWAFSNKTDNKVLFLNNRTRAPGSWQSVFYDVGLRYRIFNGQPHQISIFISNKWVASDTAAITPMPVRFITEPLYGFELEVFL